VTGAVFMKEEPLCWTGKQYRLLSTEILTYWYVR